MKLMYLFVKSEEFHYNFVLEQFMLMNLRDWFNVPWEQRQLRLSFPFVSVGVGLWT